MTVDRPEILSLRHGEANLKTLRFRSRDGQIRSFRELEARLLGHLAAHPDTTCTYAALLRAVWGYRPDHPRAVIHTAVRRLRKVINDPASQPTHLFSVRGEGYRFAPLAAIVPTPSSPQHRPGADFIGRDSELDQLRSLLEVHRLVTIVGPGGCGKTRLAREFEARFPDRFPAGVHFVDLSEAHSAPAMMAEIARTLRFKLGATDLVGSVGRALAKMGSALFILDNFEQLATFGAPPVSAWAEQLTDGRLLITSRIALHSREEHLLPLPLLETPPEGADLARICVTPAVVLFTQRARARRHSFAITEENADDIAQLVRMLDGLPLAIELAAARARVMNPAKMCARLRERIDLLRNRTSDRPARHRSLRATLDWSWQLLDDGLQTVLTQCAIFEGGFTLDAAEAIIDFPTGRTDWSAEDFIELLLEHSLLHPQGEAMGELRFGMLQLVREYVLEHLSRLPPRALDALRQRVVRFFIDHAAQLTHGERERWGRIENDNLTAALRHAQHASDIHMLGKLVASQRMFIGLQTKAIEMVQQAADRQTHGDLNWLDLMILRLQLMDDQLASEALALSPPVLAAAKTLNDPKMLVRIHHVLGRIHFSMGDSDQSEAHLQTALQHATVETQEAEEAILPDLGRLYRSVGKLDQAERVYRRAIALHAARGDTRREALALDYLSSVYVDRGQLVQALTFALRALESFRENQMRHFQGNTASKAGSMAFQLGQITQADALIAEGLAVSREIDNAFGYIMSLLHRAEMLIDTDDPQAALTATTQARVRANGYDHVMLRCYVDLTHSAALLGCGRLDDAKATLDAVADRSDSLNAPFFSGLLAQGRGQLALARGATQEADHAFTAAIEHFQNGHAVLKEAECWVLRAKAASQDGDNNRFHQALTQADARITPLNLPPTALIYQKRNALRSPRLRIFPGGAS